MLQALRRLTEGQVIILICLTALATSSAQLELEFGDLNKCPAESQQRAGRVRFCRTLLVFGRCCWQATEPMTALCQRWSCCTATGRIATVQDLSHLGLLKGPTLFAYKVTLPPSLKVCDAAFTEAVHREATSAVKQKALPRMVCVSLAFLGPRTLGRPCHAAPRPDQTHQYQG